MAPFGGFALFGDAGDPSLPDTIQPSTRGVDSAFERFIDGALTKLYNESSARTEDGRALRASCKPLLGDHPSPTICHVPSCVPAPALLHPLRARVATNACRVASHHSVHVGSLAPPSLRHACCTKHPYLVPQAHHLMPITETMRADKLRDTEGRVSAPLDKPTAAWLLEPLRMG